MKKVKTILLILTTLCFSIGMLLVVNANAAKVSTDKSKTELQAAVSQPMTKDNYQNLENNLLDAAKVDDIHNSSDPGTQGSLTSFHNQLENILDKKVSKKELKKEKKYMTSADYKTYKGYVKKLNAYLNSLHDYASEYQTATPVLNDNNTTESEKSDYHEELNEVQTKFNDNKQAWSDAYDNIMNN